MSNQLPIIDTLEDILKKVDFLSSSDINKLMKLKSADGDLLSLEHRDVILETLSIIKNLGMDKSYEYFKKNQRLSRMEIIKNSDLYSNFRKEAFLEKTRTIRAMGDIKESVYVCPKCGGRKIETSLKQTRRADEPMTEFNKCMICNHKWTGAN
jgi:DNA-directed RNA polymerase subunit M/transcription elongation factor TFIIS